VDDPLRRLDELARAAEAHGARDLESADRALAAEAGGRDPARVERLAACYGAWLGRLAVSRWGAAWVGLSEPVAPRLRVNGVLVSPIDAVRRRLTDPKAPSLVEVAALLEAWSREKPDVVEANRAAWDRLAEDPRFAGFAGLPDDPESALDEWVRAEGVRGKDLLCLGAGGGRQGPLHAAAGARVTVVDLSERQLDHDRRAGLGIRCVRASIDDLSPLAAASFDVVVQPVSSCYVPDVSRVHAEVARVLRPGGLYVVQHKQPASLQAEGDPPAIAHPCRDGLALPASGAEHREAGTAEFVHSLEALLGGLCRAGFGIEDVVEPPRADALAPAGSAERRAWWLPPYVKVKARRNGESGIGNHGGRREFANRADSLSREEGIEGQGGGPR
jgi:SAM-dependent methyltransferase